MTDSTAHAESTGSRASRVRDLFDEIADLDPHARQEALMRHCPDDASIRTEVAALLEHDSNSGVTFLNPPLLDLKPQPTNLHEGAMIAGRYQVIRMIGQGGMGDVYLAQQDHPQRNVALKLIRAPLVSPSLQRRFEREAELLGALQHSGIAQVYDAGNAGTISSPQPYMAMEFVDGLPLLEHVSRHRLSTDDRLRLMMQICDAVHHAHTKGVIHRDLKPANILVTDDGHPKVLDFGVARAVDTEQRTMTLLTSTGQLVGTLAYMSPEQVGGSTRDVDVRSDVYALGVILFELLSGRKPLDLGERSIPDAARVIRDIEPTMLATLDGSFKGDLNTIVAKALEKERERRYQSAAELAADIGRHLRDEPITARPASTVYQLRKFARRNKALVGGVIGVMFALVLGLASTTMAMFDAQRQRDEASRQASIAEAVNHFLNYDLLSAANPAVESNRDITLREVLDVAAERIEGRFADQPLVEASVRRTVAQTYYGLAEYAKAESMLAPAVAILERERGAEHDDTLRAQAELAVLFGARGDVEREAEELNRIHRKQSALHGADHFRTLESKHALAGATRRMGEFERAAEMLQETLDARRRVLGPDHEHTMETAISLAAVLNDLSRFDESVPLLETIVATSERDLGVDHPNTMHAVHNLAYALSNRGDFEEAERRYRDVYERRVRVVGETHNDTQVSLNGLATALQNQGKLEEAEGMFRRALAVQSEMHGPRHPNTLTYLSNLANALLQQEKYAEAEPLAKQAVDTARTALPAGHWAIGAFLVNYGQSLAGQERYVVAIAAFEEAMPLIQGRFGMSNARTIRTMEMLIDAYVKNGQDEKADALRASLPADDDGDG